MSIRILSMTDLAGKGISFSRVHIYRLIKTGLFPKPIRLGSQRIGFVESEIDAWLEAKIGERDSGADDEVARKLSLKAISAVNARDTRKATCQTAR